MAAYEQDGEVAKRIAAVIPYYPFKGIPRFYDVSSSAILARAAWRRLPSNASQHTQDMQRS